MDRNTATDLTCRELVELVTDYLEHALRAHDRERFEAHVVVCDGCATYVEQIRTTVCVTAQLRALEPRAEISALLETFRSSHCGT